jgi:CDP-diacylglycerol---glycerol-3-phosphate 3-phosphatidyltransferase
MWNAPNILTLARLSVLPLIVFLIWPGIENRQNCYFAALVYGFGGFLDIVDGYIARRYDLVTTLGKFLDPLADKLFYLVTLIALLQLPGPRIPPWIVMLLLVRELAITGLRGIAASEGIVIQAGVGGKLKATFATLGAIGLLLHYPYLINYGVFIHYIDMHTVGLNLTMVSLVLGISSGVHYAYDFAVAVRQKR